MSIEDEVDKLEKKAEVAKQELIDSLKKEKEEADKTMRERKEARVQKLLDKRTELLEYILSNPKFDGVHKYKILMEYAEEELKKGDIDDISDSMICTVRDIILKEFLYGYFDEEFFEEYSTPEQWEEYFSKDPDRLKTLQYLSDDPSRMLEFLQLDYSLEGRTDGISYAEYLQFGNCTIADTELSASEKIDFDTLESEMKLIREDQEGKEPATFLIRDGRNRKEYRVVGTKADYFALKFSSKSNPELTAEKEERVQEDIEETPIEESKENIKIESLPEEIAKADVSANLSKSKMNGVRKLLHDLLSKFRGR